MYFFPFVLFSTFFILVFPSLQIVRFQYKLARYVMCVCVLLIEAQYLCQKEHMSRMYKNANNGHYVYCALYSLCCCCPMNRCGSFPIFESDYSNPEKNLISFFPLKMKYPINFDNHSPHTHTHTHTHRHAYTQFYFNLNYNSSY